jgi:formylglycine-generating enzyme required for sulfatase activity/predicted ATPase
MVGIDILLGAALEAGLGVLAEAGFGDEARALKERLTKRSDKERQAAFDLAFDQAVQAAGEESLRPLLDHQPFREAVAAGLLDPEGGFDLQTAGDVWGEQLPAHARALRRFFSALENALLADKIWGPVLDRYQDLRFRDDVLNVLRERNLEVPPRQIVSTVNAQLTGSGAIAQGPGAVAASAGGMAVGGDVMGDVIQMVVDGLTVEMAAPGPRPDTLRAAYLNWLFETTSRLSLAGVDPKAASESEARLNLGEVYTALLTVTAETHERLERGDVPDREVKRLSALTQLNRHPHLVLLGDPGSGKSTFVNFVAMCLAGEALGRKEANLALLMAPLPDDEGNDQEEAQPWEHGLLVPVRVILRDFAARSLPAVGERASADHLWQFIVSGLSAAALGDYAQHLRRELLDHGGLLLLDGLDEVPEADHRREQIKQAVEDFAAVFPRCRVLVTSRTYAYQKQNWRLPGFAETVLASFSAGQVRRFVDRWYAHIAALRGMHPEDAQGRAELLKRAIFGSDRLSGLAQRPLLLTLMASLHAWRGGSLPEKREELYADTVDLLLDWWESPKMVRDGQGQAIVSQPSLAEWLKVDREKVRELLNELAYQAHAAQPELVGTADVPEGELVSGLMRLSQNPDVNPARLVEYLSQRAGLLLPRGVGVYTFPHRTFQEYLSACYLTDHDYPDRVADLARKQPGRWREVALLAGAKAARGTASAIWLLVEALCYREPRAVGENDLADIWGAHLAGQVLAETSDLTRVSERDRVKVKRVQGWLLRILKEGTLPAVERAAAGNSLAHLGDPRFREDAWHLPDEPLLGFVEVPAGSFVMGSDKQQDPDAYEDELPQHSLNLPTYYIARYPVTVAQFRAFVQASEYEARGPWERESSLDNHPVVAVTWYDTQAYCSWLTEQLRSWDGVREPLARLLREEDWVGRSPTEAEWEKAARGADGRIYPWGGEPDADRANYGDTGIGTTSAVGCFWRGASPYGVLDLSGNTWEWTCSLWGRDWRKPDFKYPYDPEDGREDLEADSDILRVLRGGSFDSLEGLVRCASRWDSPDVGSYFTGFRVVIAPGF